MARELGIPGLAGLLCLVPLCFTMCRCEPLRSSGYGHMADGFGAEQAVHRTAGSGLSIPPALGGEPAQAPGVSLVGRGSGPRNLPAPASTSPTTSPPARTGPYGSPTPATARSAGSPRRELSPTSPVTASPGRSGSLPDRTGVVVQRHQQDRPHHAWRAISIYYTQNSSYPLGASGGMARGSDGAMWFANGPADSIGRITTSVTPEITRFTPHSGGPETRVSIWGHSITRAISAAFNGIPARISARRQDRIIVRVRPVIRPGW